MIPCGVRDKKKSGFPCFLDDLVFPYYPDKVKDREYSGCRKRAIFLLLSVPGTENQQ